MTLTMMRPLLHCPLFGIQFWRLEDCVLELLHFLDSNLFGACHCRKQRFSFTLFQFWNFSRLHSFSEYFFVLTDDMLWGSDTIFLSNLFVLAQSCVEHHWFVVESTICLINLAHVRLNNGSDTTHFPTAFMNVSAWDNRGKQYGITVSAGPHPNNRYRFQKPGKGCFGSVLGGIADELRYVDKCFQDSNLSFHLSAFPVAASKFILQTDIWFNS